MNHPSTTRNNVSAWRCSLLPTATLTLTETEIGQGGASANDDARATILSCSWDAGPLFWKQ